MDELCKTCKYFTQHYIVKQDAAIITNCGHCRKRKGYRIPTRLKTCAMYEKCETVQKRIVLDVEKKINYVIELLTKIKAVINEDKNKA